MYKLKFSTKKKKTPPWEFYSCLYVAKAEAEAEAEAEFQFWTPLETVITSRGCQVEVRA